MIDTITIKLSESEFVIHDHSKFCPDSSNFFNRPFARFGGRAYIDAYQNPTRTELKEGKYKPQLTLRKRWGHSEPQINLFVQFSGPKLLYKNNFDELTNSDLITVKTKLGEVLHDMGIGLRIKNLGHAKIIKIHYGKNIILPEYIIPSMVIGEVKKVDYNLHTELTEKDYRNAGHSARFHTNNYELIIYDKKKDLQKAMQSEKRSIESKYVHQPELFDYIKKTKEFEVIRIEARLNNKTWIQKETGVAKNNHTLEKLFNSELSMKVLRKSWKSIINNYELLKPQIDDKEKFLASFMVNNPEAKLTKALSAFGYLECIQHLGTAKFRNLVEARYSKRTWYELKKTMLGFNLSGKLPDQFDAVTGSLKEYKPLRLKDFDDSL